MHINSFVKPKTSSGCKMTETAVVPVDLEDEDDEEEVEEEPQWTEHTSLVFLQTVAWLLAGIIFGVALEKSRGWSVEFIQQTSFISIETYNLAFLLISLQCLNQKLSEHRWL